MIDIKNFLVLIFGLLLLANAANAQSSSEQLQQMVEQLQKTPNDDALREKIIKLAAEIRPALALPEEARKPFVMGVTVFKKASDPAGAGKAVELFTQAINVAPWFADAYYNRAIAHQVAGQFEPAIDDLRFFLGFKLTDTERREAQDKMYSFEAEAQLATAKKAEEIKATAVKAGAVFRDCNDCPEMVVLPAGSTGQAFAMGKYEVTQGQWRAVMGNNPSHFSNCGDTCPVEQVSWNDAKEFIQRLNAKTGKQYRLPTEAEWEYACRAGRQQEYCGSDSADSVAWYDANSGETTHPAGRKQPNAFGLYDMSGNVWEWVEDCYDGGCRWRVLRGGSWNYGPQNSRAALRGRSEPASRFSNYGFRLARMLP